MNGKALSKLISFWLRHDPGDGNLDLDRYGRANLDMLIRSLKFRSIELQRNDLVKLCNSFDKKRWDIDLVSNTIRATHGHSISIDQLAEAKVPPRFLYHGTPLKNVKSILDKGLLKMNREYVHLSADPLKAHNIGLRNGKSIIVVVDTTELVLSNHRFYNTENDIWLSYSIPSQYLQLDPWKKVLDMPTEAIINTASMTEVLQNGAAADMILKPPYRMWNNLSSNQLLIETANQIVYQVYLSKNSAGERYHCKMRREFKSFDSWLSQELLEHQKTYFEIGK